MQYVKLVVRFPWIFILAPVLLASTLLPLIIYLSDLPSFHEPRKGFETRRTLISNQLLAYKLLLKKSLGFKDYFNADISNNGKKADDDDDDFNEEEDEDFDESSEAITSDNIGDDNFFCGRPDDGYSKIVYEGKDERSLFNFDDLRAICIFEEDMLERHKNSFAKYCDKAVYGIASCCKSFSLPNYVALFSGKTSCRDITDLDFVLFKDVVNVCLGNVTVYKQILKNPVKELPKKDACNSSDCLKCFNNSSLLEDILFYITDESFSRSILNWHLKNLRTILPLSRGLSSKDFFYDLEFSDLSSENFSVVAMDFGLKQEIFDELLIRDTYLCLCGIFCISCLLFCYTRSFLITLGTLLQIFMSLIFTYSVYRYVFGFSFFPFLNMLAIVILIATGVDNTFVIYHIWCQLKLQNHQASTIHDAMRQTLSHAFKSLFVTSATTSAALFSGFVSDVIVLKCFAIFSGTSLVFHFFVAMLMMPAVIVLHVKCSAGAICFGGKFQSFCSRIDNACADFFQTCIFQLIIRFKWIWVCLFSTIGLISFFIVSVTPKLKLPSSNNLQLFIKTHPFEVYEMIYKEKFAFDKPGFYAAHRMPLRFVWGLRTDDEGSVLDPDDDGKMVTDPSFDIATPAAQQFLFDFCRKVRMTEYFKPKPGFKLSNCFIEKFKLLMSGSCRDVHKKDIRPCCIDSKFPYTKDVFDKCLNYFLPKIAYSNLFEQDYKEVGLRFNANYSKILALIIEFTSNQSYKPSYVEMQKLYNSMKGFTDIYLQYNAPTEMSNGWFLSDLGFYDLQHSLVVGTPISLFLSIAVAAIFAFVTTRNVMITGLAMLSISTSIMITIAILVLDGWELEVFESMSISLAVGLSIDYALHYGIAYQHSQGDSRQSKVIQTIRMSSAVALAAATTFFVGLFLVPSVVLAYRQLAIFLMTVTSISWLCSTFFYMSLLVLIGPRGTFGEVKCFKCPDINIFKLKNTSESNSPNLSSTGTIATTANPTTETKSNETSELMGIRTPIDA